MSYLIDKEFYKLLKKIKVLNKQRGTISDEELTKELERLWEEYEIKSTESKI